MPTLPISVPYTFGSQTNPIPLSYLDSDFSTITIAVNGIGSGNTPLANVQITGGNSVVYTSNASYYSANGIITTSVPDGAYSYGTLSYSDTNIFASYQTSANSYSQVVAQNTNAGTAASANFIVSNDLGTATTYFGEFGINSSGFTGSGSLTLPNATYVTATSGDLVLGTTTANSIRFVVNSGATDALTISSTGSINVGNVTLTSATVPIIYGGNTASSTLTLQSTSGAGTTDAILFKVGNAGATTAMYVNTSGNVGVGTTSPSAKLDVLGATTGDLIVRGSTGRGNITTNTGAADASGILVGTTTFQGGASTSGSAESRLSIIASGTEGSTANNRGGNIQFYTKQSNSNTINEAMRIDSSGNVGIGTSSPAVPLNVVGTIYSDGYAAAPSYFGRRAQGTLASPTATTSGVILNQFLGVGYSGSAFGTGTAAGGMQIIAAEVFTATNQGNYLVFNTTPTASTTTAERMRIDSSGNVSIGPSGTASGTLLLIDANMASATNGYGVRVNSAVQTNIVSAAFIFGSTSSLASTTAVANFYHYYANPSSGGASSSVSSIHAGFVAAASIGTAGAVSAGTAAGFVGAIVSASNRYNLYMSGSANNYLGGKLGIGTTTFTGSTVNAAANLTGATQVYGFNSSGVVQTDATSTASSFISQISQTGGATTALVYHFNVTPGAGGGGSLISLASGYVAGATLGTTGAATITDARGFYGQLATAANRWNLYMEGTAPNYLAGSLGIGTTTLTSTNLALSLNITGATTSYGISQTGVVQSGVTTAAYSYESGMSSAAAAFTLTSAYHFAADPNAGGAGSIITNQYGFYAAATLATAGAATVTNAYGFHSNLAAATNKYNFYSAGTANNLFSGYSFGLGGVQNSTTSTATNTATLTATQVASGFIVGTPTATASYTLPTAAALDTELSNSPTGTNFELIVFTTAAFAITILTNTGWTLLGSMATGATANSFARFRARKTGAGAWSLYRVS